MSTKDNWLPLYRNIQRATAKLLSWEPAYPCAFRFAYEVAQAFSPTFRSSGLTPFLCRKVQGRRGFGKT